MKTYLNLPKRVDARARPSKAALANAAESFPALLDLLQNYSGDRLAGISLADVEWYHRLRNQLYHNGNGITVDRAKAEAYFQIAIALFEVLFEYRPDLGHAASTLTGKYIVRWNAFQTLLRRKLPPKGDSYAYFWKTEFLETLDPRLSSLYKDLSLSHLPIVHGQLITPAVIKSMIRRIDDIETLVQAVANMPDVHMTQEKD